ncbi:MAG: hypothetical protein AB4062_16885 [Crocosphaera sp.]
MSQENASPISSNLSNDSDSLNNQLSQEQLINALETTMTKLDVIVNYLNEKTIETLPSQEILETLINSTQTIANSLESQDEVSTSATSVSEVAEETEEWEETLETSEETPTIEQEETRETRPSGGNGLSRWGIIGGISIILAVLSASFFFFKSSLPDFEIPQINAELPQPEVVETPPKLDVPELPQPIKNAPPSQPKLTPEQSLIAAIQKEVTALTNEYSEDLIGKIEANFLRSRLIVTMEEQWYSLSNQEQDNLATNILTRAKSLDFRKLELVDTTGELIARSPLVGKGVIILQRHH